jgi:hypothetical protein
MGEQTVKITDGKTLQSFLGAVFDEGYKSSLAHKALTEKERQLKTAGNASGKGGAPQEEPGEDDVDSLFGGSDGGGDTGDGGEGAEDAESPMPDMPEEPTGGDDDAAKLKAGNISVKDIVEKLNSIRSGKSFKDSAVSKAIDQYVEKLKKPERTALMAFLNGIAQIVTGEVAGNAAEDPGAQPADVEMQKGNEPKTVQKKPNIIKGGEHSKAAPKAPGQPGGEEDTTPPAPITPKRRGG